MFTYTALDCAGRQTTGSVPAPNRAAAMDQVIGQGLSPLSIEEDKSNAAAASSSAEGRAVSTRVSTAAVESFTRELANLLAAGLPLSRAVHLLRREVSSPGAKHVWSRVHDDVVGGVSLAEAMAKWPKVFSSVYVAMVRAGEAGGVLRVVLPQMADFRTPGQEVKGKGEAALVYPCGVGLLAGGGGVVPVEVLRPPLW